MPNYGSTDQVRRTAASQYVEPARIRGDKTVKIHSGALNKLLVDTKVLPPNRLPIVCNALSSLKFQKENHLVLENIQGPPSGRSSTVVFTYRIEPAATLSSKNGGNDASSFKQLRGILKETYRKLGGAEGFHKNERQSWER